MRVTVNGEGHALTEGMTMADLVGRLNLHPRRIAVERNKRLVRRTDYADTPLADNDVIEIVTLVGGG